MFGLLRAEKERPRITWQLLKRAFSYALPYRWLIFFSLIMILLDTGIKLINPLILRTLIDETIPQKNINQLILLATAMLLIPVVTGGISIISRRLNAEIGEGVIYDLRVALYSRLQRMSLRFFTDTRTGELMSRLNNDVTGAQNAISNSIVRMITNIIQALALLVVMLSMEWRMTIASVFILPIFFLLAKRMGSMLREIAHRSMDANARMNATMNETLNISGAILVKLFGRSQLEVERFKGRAEDVKMIGIKRALLGASFTVVVGLVSAFSSAFVYGVGGYLVISDVFTIGTIVAFGSYLGNLYDALQGLANTPIEFASSMVSFERVFEILDLPIEIEEKTDAIILDNIKGELAFSGVTFQYKKSSDYMISEVRRFGRMENVDAVLSGEMRLPKEEPEKFAEIEQEYSFEEQEQPLSQARQNALDRVSFHVDPGMLVALVGPSGAGKTTLTYLIPRLYDPNSGSIQIDGKDIRNVTLESLSAQIGMVTQETHLFHDTIRTNLLYAKLDATQAELEEACKTANIHDFIRELPDGYDTIVGERGYRLSGGEKQRVALARVILKDPRILVLDEATSHLDSESEALIQAALKNVMVNRTSIVIAHRLSTILAADKILVMDRGRIIESGKHQELIALGGIYANLYSTQFERENYPQMPQISADDF